MKADRWSQIQELYHEALDQPPGERGNFLSNACAKDPELRREVESLLAHEGEADSLLESPAWTNITSSNETAGEQGLLSSGTLIGSYRVAEKLGSGGMGEVYRATDIRLQRDVALKLLTASAAHDEQWITRLQREALVLASLNHPHIAAIYGLEESGELRAIAMELVEGQTLAERIARGPIPIRELLAIGKQLCEALAYAHKRSVVHRDLKPANVIVTVEGHVKLLDFGLARRVQMAKSEPDTLSGKGVIAGTLSYMSPEQVRGLPVDHRTDLFSFGVVLYEMLTQRRPFEGSSPMAVWDAILHDEPGDFGDSQAPTKLRALIRKLLEKDPLNRYRSAGEVCRELSAIEVSLSPVRAVRLARNAWIGICAAILLIGILGGWLWHRWSRERWALATATPAIERLEDAGQYVKAAALAREARAVLPNDSALEKLWRSATGEVSIASVPSGADVSIRPYAGDPNVWQPVGKTPLKKVRVPRDAYVWRITKPGFATMFFIGEPPPSELPPGYHAGFSWNFKLRPAASVPPEMLVIPGGWAGLAYPLAYAPSVEVDDFLIDMHEITNEEYKKFVDAGGYKKQEFWKQPFVKDGRTVPWEEAVARFHDATGRPGPATWEVGDYPKAHEKYPVAGVSWYEAAAYAEFAGKSLPTAYHWARASQSARYTPLIAPNSNFRSGHTWPAGTSSALSGFGTRDMAGNVKEWCWNETGDAKRLIMGGGVGEPEYMFNHTDAQSPWDRMPNFGFRCVKFDSPPAAAATAHIDARTRDYWKEEPVSDDVFKVYLSLYAYDKGELNAKTDETATTDAWIRERVTFDAAYGHERVPAYLYLPKNASPPFQTIVYWPGAFAFLDDKLDLTGLEEERGFLVKSGRALIFPIYKGMYERRDGLAIGGKPLGVWRDHFIAWTKDLGRSLDYLETRKDIDASKVAYLGESMGGVQGARLPAIEKRIKTSILLSGGFQLAITYLPEVDPLNFVRHVTIPVLMLNGRYDASFPLESSQRPLFQFLGTPAKDKKHVIYEGGHGAFPRPDAVRECLEWLDKYLGPVRR